MLLRALLFFIAYLITVAAAAVATNPWYTHLGPNVTSSGNNTHYFEISNNCPFTVWPAVVAGQKEAKWPALTGFELPPQNRRRVATYGTFQGRIWPRLGCFFDSAGIGHCATGDCDSRLECGFKTGEPGVVLAEVNMGGAEGQMFYDISLVDGFDVDVLMEPISTGEWTGDTLVCKPSASNLTALFDPGNFRMIPPRNHREPEAWYNHVRPVASDCKRYGSPEVCCTFEYSRPETCNRSRYAPSANTVCPDAYGYAYDDGGATFVAPQRGALGFRIEFCPAVATSTRVRHEVRLRNKDYNPVHYIPGL